MSAAKVIANDGIYRLLFYPLSKTYRAGCHRFNKAKAIEHWTKRQTEPCVIGLSIENCVHCQQRVSRAKLFLQALQPKKRAPKKKAARKAK